MELISREAVLKLARTVYTNGGIPTQIVEVYDIKRLPTIMETETWYTSKGTVEMPKGVFDKIFEEKE